MFYSFIVCVAGLQNIFCCAVSETWNKYVLTKGKYLQFYKKRYKLQVWLQNNSDKKVSFNNYPLIFSQDLIDNIQEKLCPFVMKIYIFVVYWQTGINEYSFVDRIVFSWLFRSGVKNYNKIENSLSKISCLKIFDFSYNVIDYTREINTSKLVIV